MPPTATDVTATVCGLSERASVTLEHPVKAIGRNEKPFGRDTRMC